MKLKKGNDKRKEENQIGEKRGFYQAVAVVLSAQKNKTEEKEKKETKKKQQQNLTFLSELYERKKKH